jgi:hypothetical protein
MNPEVPPYDVVLKEGETLTEEDSVLLDDIEKLGRCVRCSTELEEDHNLFLTGKARIGSTDKIIKLPICADCRAIIKALQIGEVYGTGAKDLQSAVEKIADLGSIGQVKEAYDEKMYKQEQRQDQPWRERGRSKKSRRYH